MKKIITFISYLIICSVLLSISACGKRTHMTRAETIAAIKECEDAGLRAVIYRRIGWDGSITRIDCTVKENNCK